MAVRGPGLSAGRGRFLTRALGGPLRPGGGRRHRRGRRRAERIPDGEARFAADRGRPGGFRTLAQVALPGRRDAVRRPAATLDPPTASAGDAEPCRPTTRLGTRSRPRRVDPRVRRPRRSSRTISSGSCTPAGAPDSSKNRQRWAFIVCRDREHLRELAGGRPVGRPPRRRRGRDRPRHARSARVADAPLSILFDLGQAAENMMLAAWELGIGSVPATVYEHDLAASCSATRPTSTASTSCRSATRPTRPTSPARRRPAGGVPLDGPGPRGTLVGAPAYCQRNLRAAIAEADHQPAEQDRGADPQRGERRAADHDLAQRVGQVGQRDEPGDRSGGTAGICVDREERRPTGTSSGTGRPGHAVGRVLGLRERREDVAERQERDAPRARRTPRPRAASR